MDTGQWLGDARSTSSDVGYPFLALQARAWDKGKVGNATLVRSVYLHPTGSKIGWLASRELAMLSGMAFFFSVEDG